MLLKQGGTALARPTLPSVRLIRMKRAHAAGATIPTLIAALALVRCSADEPGTVAGAGAPDCGAEAVGDGGVTDGAVVDAADPRCQTQPTLLTTHPHAAVQDSSVGTNLIDTRGWNGRVYFGYGDINWNTGPIVISSYDPTTKTWEDHLTFNTERIERLRVIGDHLWAPATDPRGDADPEYAIGSAQHEWSEVDIGRSIKVLDVAERAAGDVFLVGSDLYLSDAGTFDNTFGAAAWRSQNGGPFERAFPIINPDPFQDYQYVDMNALPFLNAAALDGKLYAGTVAPPWIFDGTEWTKGPQLGGFIHPVTFAGQIVFDALGELWAFDGTHKKNLGIQLVETSLAYTFVQDPIAVLNDSEGRILVVNAKLETLVTTDLVEWHCIGQAPADVRSIGSLNGTVYFGGPEGRVYGYSAPSW